MNKNVSKHCKSIKKKCDTKKCKSRNVRLKNVRVKNIRVQKRQSKICDIKKMRD